MRKPPRFLLYSLLAEGLVPPPFFFPPPRIKTAIAAALPPRRSTKTAIAAALPPQHAHKNRHCCPAAARAKIAFPPSNRRARRSSHKPLRGPRFLRQIRRSASFGGGFLKFTLQISSLCCTPCNLRRFGLYFGHRMRKGAGARRPGAAAVPSAGRKYKHKECRQ